jgi:ElaB/YqjD/DUF883 family membrane-anchored ribosome-binding protein
MDQMDDTRKDLADKLEQLEKKVSGTVETVTDFVEKVPETVETVKETIAETVSTVSDTVQHTVGAVKETVADTVESVKSFFDIPYQVDRHPWLMLGGSVLMGYLGGRLLPRRSAAEKVASAGAVTPAPAPVLSEYAPQTYEPVRGPQEPRQAEPSKPSWLSSLGERFSGEINQVKGLALGTLLGVARDMVSQWAPDALRQEVTDVINNFTRDVGGKVIQGPVLGDEHKSPAAA